MSGVHTQTHTQETHTHPHPKEPGCSTQLRNNVSMQTRTGVCCVYRSRYRHIHRGCGDVFKRVHTHTDPHKHARTFIHTWDSDSMHGPNPGGRESVWPLRGPSSLRLKAHVRACAHTHTHKHALREALPFTGALDSGTRSQDLVLGKKALCVLGWGWRGCESSCSSSRIRGPGPFRSPLPWGGRSGRARDAGGSGGARGPAPTLGRCLWQAAQNPESHTDFGPGLASAPRMSLWPCPQA